MGAHGVGVGWETGAGVQGSDARASNTNTVTDIDARALPYSALTTKPDNQTHSLMFIEGCSATIRETWKTT